MNRNLLIAANIHAGSGQVKENLAGLIDYCVSLGWEVSVHTSQHPRDLPEYIAKNAGRFDLLVSSGGDGTLNETLNGLMGCENPPLLCYIPAGTVNDFASSLKIPKNFEQAARLLETGVPFCCDIGRFGSQYFSYVAAFGAFTSVSYQTSQQSKQLFGKLAYIMEGVRQLPALHPSRMHVELEDQCLEGEFLFGMVSNSTSVAGLHFSDKFGISMQDGLLEVLLIRHPRNISEQQALLNGMMKKEPVPGLIYLFRSKILRIEAPEPIPWTLDGEFGGDLRETEISACHQALRILVPAETAAVPSQD